MKPYGPPRPLRSQGVPTLRGNVLSDRRILFYMARGYYGAERQAEALAELAERKTRKTKAEPFALALAALL